MTKTVGALWERKYQQEGDERTYWSGVINLGVLGDINIAVFKNDRKEKDNHPDLKIIISEKADKNNNATPEKEDMKDPF